MQTLQERIENNKEMSAYDFYDLIEIGEIFDFPIDDTALAMYKEITVGDLLPYMAPDYSKCHWSVILEDVLRKKGILKTEYCCTFECTDCETQFAFDKEKCCEKQIGESIYTFANCPNCNRETVKW